MIPQNFLLHQAAVLVFRQLGGSQEGGQGVVVFLVQLPFINLLSLGRNGTEAPAKFLVHVCIGGAEPKPGGGLAQYLGMDHVLEILKGDGAEVNPATLVTGGRKNSM